MNMNIPNDEELRKMPYEQIREVYDSIVNRVLEIADETFNKTKALDREEVKQLRLAGAIVHKILQDKSEERFK